MPVGKLVAGALVGARRARGLVEQFLEFDFALLEAGGVDVREVVRDDVQVQSAGIPSRRRRSKGREA